MSHNVPMFVYVSVFCVIFWFSQSNSPGNKWIISCSMYGRQTLISHKLGLQRSRKYRIQSPSKNSWCKEKTSLEQNVDTIVSCVSILEIRYDWRQQHQSTKRKPMWTLTKYLTLSYAVETKILEPGNFIKKNKLFLSCPLLLEAWLSPHLR